jgi:hypothetical protein
MLDLLCDCYQVDLQLLMKGCGDTLKHGQRVALLVSIFEPGDNGLLGAHEFSELLLAESDPGSGVIYHPGDPSVDGLLLNPFPEFRVLTGDTVDNRQGIFRLSHC